jgi:hypothetical protein
MSTNKKITRQRIANDPAFERTRENAAEFGTAGKSVKLLKAAFRDLLIVAGDATINGRLQKEAMRILHTDPASDRGRRSVGKGDITMLKGFNFNGRNGLDQTLFTRHELQIDRATGKVTVTIPEFVPRVRIQASPKATHFQIVVAAAAVDFENGTYEQVVQETDLLLWDRNKTNPLLLSLQLSPASKLPIMVGIGVNFEQAVNNKMYPLNSGAFNAAAIVQVDEPPTGG